ncbi:putative kinase-like protein TMKL1 [Ipomoea triloba]|uniref:putative kinase-like protein TMKL1 n=1 Tax=Ipomoea triloba TaxID=35885 RepID=UPI00125D3566|nr:putative kinase-like protein TMKL1 [Ipomoea triloba]
MEHKHLVILIIGLTSFCVAALVVYMWCCCRKRGGEDVPRDLEGGFEVKERDGVVGKEILMRFEGGEDLTVLDILDAPGEVIGKSGYGTLYRAALLRSNRPALLRFFRPPCTLSLKEVVPIIEVLGSIRHPNLVPLYAFYAGPRGEKLLVHSFYRRGNLAQFIRDGVGEVHKWPIICRISMGIARGLDYLHTAFEIPIVHGNLKSKNILLDGHFRPRVSDFGLHLLLTPTAGQEMLETAAVQGYKVPELIKMKDASEESDIYSLGVILLELLTGKEPMDEYTFPAKDTLLPNVVKTAIIEDRITDLFHPIVLGQSNGKKEAVEDHILELLRLAMVCCSPSPSLRPTVKEVLTRLEEIER